MTSDPTLSPGATIGPYRVVAMLGHGGTGVVWKAHDVRLGRDVALKVLPGEFTRDLERLSRFEREAKVLASLNLPSMNLVCPVSGDPIRRRVLPPGQGQEG